MQRDKLSREIIQKFEKDVYEQNLSVPWFTILSNQYNFGFNRNKLEDIR